MEREAQVYFKGGPFDGMLAKAPLSKLEPNAVKNFNGHDYLIAGTSALSAWQAETEGCEFLAIGLLYQEPTDDR